MRTATYFVTIFFVVLSVVHGYAAPVLQAEGPTFDFGEVFQGDKVRHAFTFVNAGDETLSIDRVQSSCGCTAVLVAEKSIPPGGAGEIQANFDSTRFRGAVSKTIYLYSNDPVNPTMQFHIKGTVMEKVAVVPAQVNFGPVAKGKMVEASVVLRNQGQEPLTLGAAHTTAAELVVNMAQQVFANGEEVTLTLKLTPKPGLERFSGYVLIPVEGVPKNELRIPVYATINQQ